MNQRESRGKIIVGKNNQITRIDDGIYKVKSQSSDNDYDVYLIELGWV